MTLQGTPLPRPHTDHHERHDCQTWYSSWQSCGVMAEIEAGGGARRGGTRCSQETILWCLPNASSLRGRGQGRPSGQASALWTEI